jgi:hypothetical protein
MGSSGLRIHLDTNLHNGIEGDLRKMAEKTKSATTTPKPRKTAAKKNGANTPSNVTEITVTREQSSITREVPRDEVAQLAHQLWNQRGRQHGQDADDWFRAEQLLRGKAS